MATISRSTIGKSLVATAISAAVSVLIASSLVPFFGGSYDGLGMWLSFLCPIAIAFPASIWQFHQGEKLQQSRNELLVLHDELDEMHSNLMDAYAALKQRMRIDAMTGALTREAFLTELGMASTDGRRGTLLLADADHFKRINDTFGHQTGDEALIAIAAATSATLRPTDFWGRIGGEEFAIFLDGADHAEALVIAEALRGMAEASEIHCDAVRVPVTISIGGVAVTTGFNIRQAIAEADGRLYRAKRNGRNRVELDELAESSINAA